MLHKKSIIAVMILLSVWSALLWIFSRALPDVRPLKNRRYSMTLMVNNAAGKKIPFVLGPRNPRWTPLTAIPAALQWSVIMAEDCSFYQHNGFDFGALRDALWEDLREFEAVRGGSTITQQLAKNLYLSREKSLSRKIKEAIITRKLERHLSKKRILELYLNVIELSPGIYGVGAASEYYFHTTPTDLNFYQSILLAAIIPSPKRYNPYRYPDRALDRYKTVVSLLYKAKFITTEQYNIASSVRFDVDPLTNTLHIVSVR
jgi:monofunctional biosynthetic peptidoglycan transglycosylase